MNHEMLQSYFFALQGEPVVYTYPVPSSIIDDLCDLTGNMAIWSRRPQCPHEMIDLTAEEDNLAQELVNRCLEGADDLEEVDMMDLDDYMESSRGFWEDVSLKTSM